MGVHGIVLLFAVVNLVSGARPKRPHQVDPKPALTAAFGAFTNSTGGEASLALVESQEDTACGLNILSAREDAQKNKPCRLITAQVVCEGRQVSGNYICGRNEVTDQTKTITANGCTVFMTRSRATSVAGDVNCKCMPCRKFVYVQGADNAWTMTQWGPKGSPVDSAWDLGTKVAPKSGFWGTLKSKVKTVAHSANVWISGHPLTVTAIKIVALVVIGVLTGGIGSAVAVTVSILWSTIMFALGTLNKVTTATRIGNSDLPYDVKDACIAVEKAKWVVAFIFTASAMILPFDAAAATDWSAATNMGDHIGAAIKAAVGGENSAAAGTLATYASGFVQGAVTDGAVKAVSSWLIDCTDYVLVDDGYAVVNEPAQVMTDAGDD